MVCWISHLRGRGVAAKAVVLSTAVVIAFLVASPVVVHIQGATGLAAALLSASLCLLGAVLALAVGRWFADPKSAVMVGMAVRMAVPLSVVLIMQLRGGPLVDAGLIYYLLVFYPVTLLVETALALPRPSVALTSAATPPRHKP